jgi:hypothetical protein
VDTITPTARRRWTHRRATYKEVQRLLVELSHAMLCLSREDNYTVLRFVYVLITKQSFTALRRRIPTCSVSMPTAPHRKP